MLISTAMIYAVGLLIDKFDNKQKIRTALFIISLVYNLGILIVFKYSTSFIENINSLFGANIYNPKLPLPIGLSFYTFQALSYVIDVYLRKVKVQKNIINFKLMENHSNNNNLAISVQNLTKRFPHITAVDNISFNVKRGEIFGFLGPNGAGKTTTINILCTLMPPTKGTVLVNNFDIIKQPLAVRKSIGIVFQETTLDNHLTVDENLYLHAKLYGLNKNQYRRQAYPALKLLDIENIRTKTISQLSGGTKRRVEMARVFIHQPQILFLDEPTVGLDAQTKNKI